MLVLCLAGQDVLGHPNTRVFVSHCGVHSVYEAAFHGVPVVAVPFQFEQVGGGDTEGATPMCCSTGIICHHAHALLVQCCQGR